MADSAVERIDRVRQFGRERLSIEPRLAERLAPMLDEVREQVRGRRPEARVRHVGRLVGVTQGVATVRGLPEARFNELLRFGPDVYGMVFNLDPDRIGCVLLGEEENLSAGQLVEQTGAVVDVPVGDALLGRVIDPVGRPIDGEGALDTKERYPIERRAPAILDRLPVNQQLVTGIKAIDALVPIGRGQRELIVGDRATGKTALAVDAMIRQRDSGVICVYAAIGQKTSTTRQVVEMLREHGALDRCVIVVADAEDAPGRLYIAPYAATAVAEWFMHQGRDVLIVYDDLTRHARAYREVSLLLRRPPGREAYPGDIFFIHSRLLERSTHLNDDHGGGSLTALPVVETQAKNISAYIPTNLISITDGQIFLDPDLFNQGVKPAVDPGRSVSRVGGKAQLPALRAVSKELRLQYSQFKELEVFTRFGASVEKETRQKIERGKRIREALKQPRLEPLTAGQQTPLFLALERGLLDDMPLEKIGPFAARVQQRLPERHADIIDAIDAGKKLSDEQWQTLVDELRRLRD